MIHQKKEPIACVHIDDHDDDDDGAHLTLTAVIHFAITFTANLLRFTHLQEMSHPNEMAGNLRDEKEEILSLKLENERLVEQNNQLREACRIALEVFMGKAKSVDHSPSLLLNMRDKLTGSSPPPVITPEKLRKKSFKRFLGKTASILSDRFSGGKSRPKSEKRSKPSNRTVQEMASFIERQENSQWKDEHEVCQLACVSGTEECHGRAKGVAGSGGATVEGTEVSGRGESDSQVNSAHRIQERKKVFEHKNVTAKTSSTLDDQVEIDIDDGNLEQWKQFRAHYQKFYVLDFEDGNSFDLVSQLTQSIEDLDNVQANSEFLYQLWRGRKHRHLTRLLFFYKLFDFMFEKYLRVHNCAHHPKCRPSVVYSPFKRIAIPTLKLFLDRIEHERNQILQIEIISSIESLIYNKPKYESVVTEIFDQLFHASIVEATTFIEWSRLYEVNSSSESIASDGSKQSADKPVFADLPVPFATKRQKLFQEMEQKNFPFLKKSPSLH